MNERDFITDKIFSQILAVRDSGEVNMFNTHDVQREANRRCFYDLVILLEDHRKEYFEFILMGKHFERRNEK